MLGAVGAPSERAAGDRMERGEEVVLPPHQATPGERDGGRKKSIMPSSVDHGPHHSGCLQNAISI